MIHIGTNDGISCGTTQIVEERAEEEEIPVIFLEIFPVPWVKGRSQKMIKVNRMLHDWCETEGFGFVELWATFQWEMGLYE